MSKNKTSSPENPAHDNNSTTNEDRQQGINPEVDARLTQFMEANHRSTEYYRELVRENPERAVRAIMLGRMFKHEDQMRLVEKRLPLVQQWVDQTPGMMEKITERIKDVNPFYRQKAFVAEAMRQKSRLDFRPPTADVKLAA